MYRTKKNGLSFSVLLKLHKSGGGYLTSIDKGLHNLLSFSISVSGVFFIRASDVALLNL